MLPVIGLVAAGFLLGTVGVKAVKSAPAKKLYVKGVAEILKAKSYTEDIIEEAKANIDDILAEANYLNESQGCCSEEGCSESGSANSESGMQVKKAEAIA